jgi:hypothetical protein
MVRELTRKAVRRGAFVGVAELQEAIAPFRGTCLQTKSKAITMSNGNGLKQQLQVSAMNFP